LFRRPASFEGELLTFFVRVFREICVKVFERVSEANATAFEKQKIQ
jgi:hypothetical protein